MTDFGFSDLNRLAADLTKQAGIISAEVRLSMQQTAMETKKFYAADAAKGVLGKQYSDSIDYTESESGSLGNGSLRVDVGPNLARYGGKTGKGGLVPSFGIFDDPQSSGGIRKAPSRARQRAEKFAEKELVKRLEIAVDESLKKSGL